MKNTLKGYLIGVLSTVMLLGCVAYAASNTKTIEALYNNIKIYVDGVKIDPKDAAGNTVEPFIYNGTTYLPVRAVGEAIGKTVTWDGATQSVYLGEKPGDVQYLMDVCPPYDGQNYTNYVNGDSFTMSGTKYTNGFTIGSYMTYNGNVLFNINGKYSSINLDIGHIDGTAKEDVVARFFVDNKLVAEHEIKATGITQNVTIPLNYGMQLKIDFPKDNEGYPDPTTGFGNIIVR